MKFILFQIGLVLMLAYCGGCSSSTAQEQEAESKSTEAATTTEAAPDVASSTTTQTTNDEGKAMELKTATFGGGCFWCVESMFLRIDGVETVKSGYMGGHVDNPTYKQVCTGQTGHAEIVEVQFDPEKVTFEDLLAVFWNTHDPTTLNRQGNDVGTQYRSVVFYHDDAQRQLAEECKERLNAARLYPSPIVTEISPIATMYVAEDYHQDYFNSNPQDRYCNFVIPEKLAKLKKLFGGILKEDYK